MISLIFPGQGSQIIGMAREFYENFNYIRDDFSKADDLLKKNLSKIILDGPKNDLDLTENTQPAIFLVSHSIFKFLEKETNFKSNDAKYFAGHSLGEYSALCCAGAINFDQTIVLLKNRGEAMQNAVPIGEGGMIAVLGTELDQIKDMLNKTDANNLCFIANDNSNGQIVLSGRIKSLELFCDKLEEKKIKFVKLSVSAPFHCPLMNKATEEMKQKILNTEFKEPKVEIISNVTASPVKDPKEIKKLLIDQIEKTVRWRESVINMIDSGVNRFIEIGPGKVLSGLVKRIDRNVKINQVNNLIDSKNLFYD